VRPDEADFEMLEKRPYRTYFHLHLVSDATGETLNAVAKATCAQFSGAQPIEHVYALVRSPRQLERALGEIEASPGVILYTMVDDSLREQLEEKCRELGMPCVSILDPVLNLLHNYLGTEVSHKAGSQHIMDAEYFRRIEALNYTIAHDDGQNVETLNEADVVLLGVSRTSKTPTCMYLANRGIKAANVPIVKEVPLQFDISDLDYPLVVGLTASSNRLVQIRRNRLLSLKEETETDYVDSEEVKKEIVYARRLYETHDCPIIDVSRRSIEETAAAILNLYSRRHSEDAPTQQELPEAT